MIRLRAFLAEFDAAELLGGLGASTLVSFCCFIDWRLFPKLGRLLAACYDSTYMVLPLCFMAAVGGARLRRVAWVVLAITIVLVAGPLAYAKMHNFPKTWATDDPIGFLNPLGVAATLSFGTFVLSGARLDEWGVGPGDWRWWGPKLGIAIGIIVPSSFLAVAVVPGLRDFYPSDKLARADLGELFFAQGLKGACLLGEEFFWHGFALFAIARTHGKRAAVLLTSFGYFLLHKGKPELEMLSSFPGALLLGVACLRCRSFWPAFLGHWPMNFCVELAAFLYAGPR